MAMQKNSWQYNRYIAMKFQIVAISPTYCNNLYVVAIFLVAKAYFSSSDFERKQLNPLHLQFTRAFQKELDFWIS